MNEQPTAPRRWLQIEGGREHNLQQVDVRLPHEALTVVSGVSGSGKSSLVFDLVGREGQRRTFESFSSHARSLLGRLSRPEVAAVHDLSPVVLLDQHTTVRSPRSTVGTLSELYDLLRLLFARLGRGANGEPVRGLQRQHFSFNGAGACPACAGLGVQDRVDPALLVADPARTLRQGALVPTLPNGYIMYSQLTVDVLDQVCRAHGFTVDVPWQALDPAQQRVVLYGSDRLRVPFGKHPEANRLRWSGIAARPREEGYYKGIVPTIEGILQRDRNPRVLRFVASVRCTACAGSRLNEAARAVRVGGQSLPGLLGLTLAELQRWAADELRFAADQAPAGEAIRRELLGRAGLLGQLGLGYLTLDRASTTLSTGEAQRIRLAHQLGSGLRGLLYLFDEPSAGLHPVEQQRLLALLGELVAPGNTVVAVEHEPAALRQADWLIELGPGAGREGGRLLWSGPPAGLLGPLGGDDDLRRSSPGRALLLAEGAAPQGPPVLDLRRSSQGRALLADGTAAQGPPVLAPEPQAAGEGSWPARVRLRELRRHNLQGVDVEFPLGALVLVSGVSGAGKSTLLQELAERFRAPGGFGGAAGLRQLIEVDASPIGRTPRSNPATYVGLFDGIRDLFAALPEARQAGLSASQFSFNVAGGRCETCGGAGRISVGMHFLGTVELVCEACDGRRFLPAVLAVRYRGRSVLDVLEATVDEAAALFADRPALARSLEALQRLGLGYLTLGQPSTTLSGGEAQRVKLAAELGRPGGADTLYLLDEPSTGLHPADVRVLAGALAALVARGSTVVAIEHDLELLRRADWIIDLGPGSGAEGGRVVAMGPPSVIVGCAASLTGAALRAGAATATSPRPDAGPAGGAAAAGPGAPIVLHGVTTHGLRDLTVTLPHRRLTVLTGVSGSGKSSLAFDTLFAEGLRRFAATLPAYSRCFIEQPPQAGLAGASGLTPVIALRQRPVSAGPRSTVGTLTGLTDLYRLLFSRLGRRHCPHCAVPLADGRCPTCGGADPGPLSAGHFSPNGELGACRACDGLGQRTVCDPQRLVTHPGRSLLAGALDGSRSGRSFGDPAGQHVATLRAVGEGLGLDFARPFAELEEQARQVALHGTGARRWSVRWSYRNRTRAGVQEFEGVWPGFAGLVEAQWARTHGDARGDELRPLLTERPCPDCGGERLAPWPRAVRVAGRRLPELAAWPASRARAWFADLATTAGETGLDLRARRLLDELRPPLLRLLGLLESAGLGYLAADRPATTLSGGEAQRVRLAAALGGGLNGITYVLDEPTVGLHARDVAELVGLLRQLRDRGNTVVVVEHDPDLIAAADHVIELGPGAGAQGGRIVVAGTPTEVAACAASPTGRWLRRLATDAPSDSPAPATRTPRRPLIHPGVELRQVRRHNLAGVDVSLPRGGLVAVCGVSGSGKSTLVRDVLGGSAAAGLPLGCAAVRGLEAFSAVRVIDAAPLPRSPHSCAATLTGLLDRLRPQLARTAEAKAAGLRAGAFSLQTKGGRCETCAGSGRVAVGLDFLPDAEVPCADCGGRRFGAAALAVRWHERTVADWLALSVEQARPLLGGLPGVDGPLSLLEQTGLGYLPLGQSTATLSGGEAQRLKLALELLASPSDDPRPRLLLLDEPTAGLHLDDVARLLGLLRRLVEAGHTVVVVEHHLGLIAAADWVLELGPGGGDAGGRLLFGGPPAELCGRPGSPTGAALAQRGGAWGTAR